MNILGFSITREKASFGSYPVVPGSGGGWWNLIRESFPTAWQRNVEININTVLTHCTLFACISLISSDIAKLRIRLVSEDENGIWSEVRANSPFWPVLRKPNHYQTSIQFFASWMESKLIHGNTYILKDRDARGVVNALYVLDPLRVTVLCSPDGTVAYELRSDHLSGVSEENIRIPASEIIHDRWNTFFHPLVGTSPIMAAGLPATQGLHIQQNSTSFFAGGSQPGGLLTTPHNIQPEAAQRISEKWRAAYGPQGTDKGGVAVLGNSFSYVPLRVTAVDSQLLEQLKWTSESICSAFHVPAYMVGVGPLPTHNNIEAMNLAYYSQCLQKHIEDIEKLLDEGLELPKPLGTEFDTEAGLFRMDTGSRVRAAAEAIKSSAMSPDEVRKRWLDLGPVVGGDTPYMQQQNFSLAALAERDKDKPFSKPTAGPGVSPTPSMEGTPQDDDSGDDSEEAGDTSRAIDAIEWPIGSGQYWASEEERQKAITASLTASLSWGVKQLEYRPDS